MHQQTRTNRLTTFGLAAACALTVATGTFAQDRPADSADGEGAPDTASRIVAFEAGLRALSARDNVDAPTYLIAGRMSAYRVPGAAVAIIKDGEPILVRGYGFRSVDGTDAVDGDTVFSVGSVSKVVNAVLILRLVQAGLVDLDTDVNEYLTSWRVPENRHTRKMQPTLRMILSHTAGFTQSGFPDFQPREDLPTGLQTLNGEHPAKHRRVRVASEPGSSMNYSGGGITVSQVLVEDVTGMSYEEAARQYVFEPLGMTRSTFINPLPPTHGNIACAHDKKGRPRALPRCYEAMAEMAASGLWTSANDMARFMIGVMNDETFLNTDLRSDMLSRAPNSWHGLGPRINFDSAGTSFFHHGGQNDSYKAWIEGRPTTGDAIISLTNGEDGQRLGYELRLSAERAFDWSVRFPDDFATPEFE
ncbi:MAG: serine hydrolase domain-containing protein [Pseudomonadota bacterium]